MTLQPHQDAGKIRNWAKVERYAALFDDYGTLNGLVDTSYGMMIIGLDGITTEIYAPTEKEAHKQAVEFINGLK